MMLDVFVSHAHADLPVVRSCLALLEGPLGIDPSRVFCSAIHDRGVEPGHYFETKIRRSIQDAACSILLLSENFFQSTYCVMELGAVWACERTFVPLVLPPLAPGRVRDVLAGVHMLRLSEARDLDSLRGVLLRGLGRAEATTDEWEAARDAFVAELPRLQRKVRRRVPEPYAGYAIASVSFAGLSNQPGNRAALRQDLERLGWQVASRYAQHVAIEMEDVYVKKVDQGFLESRPATIVDFERCIRRLELEVDAVLHFGHDPPKFLSTHSWA